MQINYKHPLATHAAMTVLGYRRNGLPIYTIAGGSTPAEPAAPAAPAPATPPAPADPATPAEPAAPAGDGTDWKTHSRSWEKKAKASEAELEKLKAASLTDQEKAVAAARTEGRTAAESAARATAVQLAVVRASITAGADHEALLDSSSFMASLADVDPTDAAAVKAAIDKAVKANSRLAATAPAAGASGAALPGGPGTGRERSTSLGAAIGAHYGR